MGVSVVTRIAGIEPNNSMFVATADVLIANTAAETSHFGTGVGDLTMPAGWWEVGKSIHIRNLCLVSFLANAAVTIRIKLGGVTIVESTGIYGSPGASDIFAGMDFTLTCRSTGVNGKFMGQGSTMRASSGGLASPILRPLIMLAEATIDTTQDMVLNTTHQWGAASASNSLRVTNNFVEMIPSPDLGVC